jgi:hypothetical protein
MLRIPLAGSIPEELGEPFAAATNGREPPLNLHTQTVSTPVVLAAYVEAADRGELPVAAAPGMLDDLVWWAATPRRRPHADDGGVRSVTR